MYKIVTISLILVCSTFNICSAQASRSPKLISPDSLLADLTFLNDALTEAHPSLYRYTSRDSLSLLFKKAEDMAKQPMTKESFRITLQKLVANIKSGHTYFLPSPTTENRGLHFYFPFLVCVRDNKLFIFKSLDQKFKENEGGQILYINGIKASEILKNVRSYISGDGYSNSYKDFKIERTLAFINAIYCLYGFNGHFKFEIKTDERISSVKIPAFFINNSNNIDRSFLNYIKEEPTKAEEMRSVSFPQTIPSTAILKINSFNYRDYPVYRKFYHDFFTELKGKKTENLIIDLRSNSGGAFFGAVDLLKYLVEKKYTVVSETCAPVAIPSFYQNDESQSNFNLLKDVPFVKRSDGKYNLAKNLASTEQTPEKQLLFKGDIYLLTDGGTFSSATLFAASFKENRKVTIIGQETGGVETGLDSSPFTSLKLPNTGLILKLPHFYTSLNVKEKQKGSPLRPDIEVIPSPQQLNSNTDVAMNYLIDLILKK